MSRLLPPQDFLFSEQEQHEQPGATPFCFPLPASPHTWTVFWVPLPSPMHLSSVVMESNPLSVTLGTLMCACLEQPTSKYDGHRRVFQCLFQNLLKTNEFTGHINFIFFHLPSGFLSIILSLANADSFSPVLTANINNAQVTYHILQDDIWTTGQGSREPH